ncbi:unnamed protein product [Zymoseptoria tritici ST99CH_1A5]|uniref:Mid2 domain-containing protein n=1 Tax=Zymoseptoria tritici ST99CH_1A5 TaxID=1276529 RepID=A0A1Y6L7H1_ZYMTR|nr:unnamed protein product [Zymoseptoria tritici ST99CH_1A5]
MVTPKMSCPSGASFYACGAGSKFVGCCASNPCGTTGCAAGSLRSTSFDSGQYNELPDQECSKGRFYKCSAIDPPFWGCCSSNPCGTGCPQSNLAGAFLSANEATAQPYLSLNTTWSDSSSGKTPKDDSDPKSGGPKDKHETNVGAIAGGVVGGVVLIAIVAAFILMLRRRKRRAAAKYKAGIHRPQPELQAMYPDMDESMAKHGTHSYETSPALSSNPRSPGQPPYSPQPPSYWTEAQARHVSHELRGESAVEMEDSSVPAPVSANATP